MSVLPGEGTHVILYGSATFAVGARTRSGYLARPDRQGSFPVAAVLGEVTSGTKDLCRRLAREGYVAPAIAAPSSRHALDLIDWADAPGTTWADAGRLALVALGPVDLDAATAGRAAAIVLVDAVTTLTAGRPVLGLFGEATAPEARAAGITNAELVIYPGAGERFWDPGAAGYEEAIAQDAWNRLLGFLGDQIGAAS